MEIGTSDLLRTSPTPTPGCSAPNSKPTFAGMYPYQRPQCQHMLLSTQNTNERRKPSQVPTIKSPSVGSWAAKKAILKATGLERWSGEVQLGGCPPKGPLVPFSP